MKLNIQRWFLCEVCGAGVPAEQRQKVLHLKKPQLPLGKPATLTQNDHKVIIGRSADAMAALGETINETIKANERGVAHPLLSRSENCFAVK